MRSLQDLTLLSSIKFVVVVVVVVVVGSILPVQRLFAKHLIKAHNLKKTFYSVVTIKKKNRWVTV